MSNRNATFAKRQREMNQKEKARQKEQRKNERKGKEGAPVSEDGVDPDIAGIIPGPQPKPEEDDPPAP